MLKRDKRAVFVWAFFSILLISSPSVACVSSEEPLKVACFRTDITPGIGDPLCNGLVMPAKEIITPLTARGVILLNAGPPLVHCALDWVGIGNESYDLFRLEIAKVTGTVRDRVALHALHPPVRDPKAEPALLATLADSAEPERDRSERAICQGVREGLGEPFVSVRELSAAVGG